MAAARVHAQLPPTGKNARRAETWPRTPRTHPKPGFGGRPIERVSTADVLAVLAPIWTTRHETAKRPKQRPATILDRAKGSGHHPRESPVDGLKTAPPLVRVRSDHMAALHRREVPASMLDLAERQAAAAPERRRSGQHRPSQRGSRHRAFADHVRDHMT